MRRRREATLPWILPVHVYTVRSQIVHHPSNVARPCISRFFVPRGRLESLGVPPSADGDEELGIGVELGPQLRGGGEQGPFRLLGLLVGVEEI